MMETTRSLQLLDIVVFWLRWSLCMLPSVYLSKPVTARQEQFGNSLFSRCSRHREHPQVSVCKSELPRDQQNKQKDWDTDGLGTGPSYLHLGSVLFCSFSCGPDSSAFTVIPQGGKTTKPDQGSFAIIVPLLLLKVEQLQSSDSWSLTPKGIEIRGE